MGTTIPSKSAQTLQQPAQKSEDLRKSSEAGDGGSRAQWNVGSMKQLVGKNIKDVIGDRKPIDSGSSTTTWGQDQQWDTFDTNDDGKADLKRFQNVGGPSDDMSSRSFRLIDRTYGGDAHLRHDSEGMITEVYSEPFAVQFKYAGTNADGTVQVSDSLDRPDQFKYGGTKR